MKVLGFAGTLTSVQATRNDDAMQASPSVSTDLVGDRYLATIPLERRRAGGQVYTPAYLADFVLFQAGFGADSAGTLLDPACGAGIFLEQAVRLLGDALGTGRRPVSGIARPRALADLVEATLFGVDVDETACELSRAAVRRAVTQYTGLRLRADFFRSNVVREDFLFSTDVDRFSLEQGGFRFIVGNPPYVPTTRIGAEYKDRLRRAFKTAAGRLDLYAVFMERSLGLLARGGRVALVTPDKFLVSQSARDLRAFLLRGNAVRTIACFRSHKVFADAAIVPCVTVIERAGRARGITVLACGDRPDPTGRIPVLERRSVAQSTLSSEPWHLHAIDHQLALKLQASHPPLAQFAVRISAGPATGRDGVFVFPHGSQPEVEESLLRPVVRGRDLERFHITNPALDALIPYRFDTAGNSSLIDIASFPGARRYLLQHRRELEARHCVRVWGKRWYDLHDQMLVDLARTPKIIVPDVANSNRFVVDSGQFLPLHSVYYIIPRTGIDLNYLCAILNSRVAEFLIKVFAPVVKDGFNRYRRQFLATIPVPLASTEQVRRISAAAMGGLHEELDDRVADLFGLDRDEYRSLAVEHMKAGAGR
jgi:adenine-specific DNA-methyltransferase